MRNYVSLCVLGGCLAVVGSYGCGSESGDDNGTVLNDTSFDSDPTQQDSDGDKVKDWVIRGAETDPLDAKYLANGVATLPAWTVLDTRPRADYPEGTELTVRMKAVQGTTTVGEGADAREVATDDLTVNDGAMMWVNFGFDTAPAIAGVPQFYATWARLRLDAATGEQFLAVMNNVCVADDCQAKLLGKLGGLSDDFVEVKFRLHPDTGTVDVYANGETVVEDAAVKPTQRTADDRFVTILGWAQPAAFDSVTLKVLD